MIIDNKVDLSLLRQGLLHVYNFHHTSEEIELVVINLKLGKGNPDLVAFHAARKARAKNLIDAIDTNLEQIATKEKAES